MLPEAFLKRMEKLLGEEYPAFVDSFTLTRSQALRINTLKRASFPVSSGDWSLSPVPWAKEGYYYAGDIRPGKHHFHEAGAYYIQEASAMLPAACLSAAPGDFVLDLCAAPGGKSTQIASAMQNKGLLVTNEIVLSRAKILSENIERMGIRNAIVTNESPLALSKKFPAFFDRIMVDAPCSGEGMFRKNDAAAFEWSESNIEKCVTRQCEILDAAADMLSPGGRMVYSTCTFAPEEDEGSISSFLYRHPEFHLVSPDFIRTPAMDCGHPDWVQNGHPTLHYAIRLWPHKIDGEGPFCAILEKDGLLSSHESRIEPKKLLKDVPITDFPEFLSFCEAAFPNGFPFTGVFHLFGDQLYLAPFSTASLAGLKVLRPGLHIGTFAKKRFLPSHALAMALSAEDVTCSYALSDVHAAHDFISGLTFRASLPNGWYLITIDGYSLGWGKMAGNVMKNHYPKGLRKLL